MKRNGYTNMALPNVPCRNPRLCGGVQWHRPGTNAPCQSRPAQGLPTRNPLLGPRVTPAGGFDEARLTAFQGTPTWDSDSYRHEDNPFRDGAPDPEADQLNTELLEGLRGAVKSADIAGYDKDYAKLNDEMKREVDETRLALREKLGVDYVQDTEGDTWLVRRTDGAYVRGDIEAGRVNINDRHGRPDTGSAWGSGSLDKHLRKVGQVFAQVWSEDNGRDHYQEMRDRLNRQYAPAVGDEDEDDNERDGGWRIDDEPPTIHPEAQDVSDNDRDGGWGYD